MSTTFVWYSAARRQQYGPVDADALQALADRGELTSLDQIRPVDGETWSVAARYVRFGGRIPAAPVADPAMAAPRTLKAEAVWAFVTGDQTWWWAPLGVSVLLGLVAALYDGLGVWSWGAVEIVQAALLRAVSILGFAAFITVPAFKVQRKPLRGPGWRRAFAVTCAVVGLIALIMIPTGSADSASDKGAAYQQAGSAHALP